MAKLAKPASVFDAINALTAEQIVIQVCSAYEDYSTNDSENPHDRLHSRKRYEFWKAVANYRDIEIT